MVIHAGAIPQAFVMLYWLVRHRLPNCWSIDVLRRIRTDWRYALKWQSSSNLIAIELSRWSKLCHRSCQGYWGVHCGRRIAKSFALIEGGLTRITASCALSIAIPTTAGTGREVSSGEILILDDECTAGFNSPFVVPKVALSIY